MKKQGFTIKVARLDLRKPHRKALFDKELPYAHKVEKSSIAYIRKPKHANGKYHANLHDD